MAPTDPPADLVAWWEARYTGSDRVWSGRVNRVLADVAATLRPGSALDLGCGEGGDAVWLAEQGWTTTGVDVSPTAVQRARAAAAERGLADRTTFEAGDLATWTTDGRFDLVTASFLHSWPVAIPRERILRRAAGFVAPGGSILVTAHAAPPPWAPPEMTHGHVFPTPASDLAALGLDPAGWETVVAETRDRDATGPDGASGTLTDAVVLARRHA